MVRRTLHVARHVYKLAGPHMLETVLSKCIDEAYHGLSAVICE